MNLAPIKTKFFTFYSFKGGVGRSMALLNCAYILAASGRRVLMIDMDLEAPGLTFLLQRLNKQIPKKKKKDDLKTAEIKNTPGVIEILKQFLDNPSAWPLGQDQKDNVKRLFNYIAYLPIPGKIKAKETDGKLAIMPAGRIDESFESEMVKVRLDASPLNRLRDTLFKHLKDMIIKSESFDYVLIDSRTGFSDEGYISSRILADHIVALTGLNDQNIIGTSRFLKHVNEWNNERGSEPRRVILVKTPIPVGEGDAKIKRGKIVYKMFKEHTGRYLDFTATLHYDARMALYEELMVVDWPNENLAKEYFKLTGLLRSLALDGTERWEREALESLRPSAAGFEGSLPAPDYQKSLAALETLKAIDPQALDRIAITLFGIINSLEPPSIAARPIFKSLNRWFPCKPQYYYDHARFLIKMQDKKYIAEALKMLDKAKILDQESSAMNLAPWIESERGIIFKKSGKIDQALKAFKQAKKDAKDIDNIPAFSNALFLESYLYRIRGDYALARKGYSEAMEIFNQINARRGIPGILCLLAELDLLQGDYKQARKGLSEAMEKFLSFGDRKGISAGISSLAELDHLQGNYTQAHHGYSEAMEIYRSKGDREGISLTLHSLAELDRLQGDYDKARKGYTEALEIMRSTGDLPEIAVIELSLAGLNAILSTKYSIEKLLDAIHNAKQFQDPYSLVRDYLLLSEALVAHGDDKAALDSLKKALTLCQNKNFRGQEAEVRAMRALILAKQGDVAKADEDARAAIAFFDEQSVKHPKRSELDAILAKK